MPDFIRLVGANQVVEVFGVRLVGVNADTGVKLLVSIGFLLVVVGVSRLLQRVARGPRDIGDRSAFWVRQGIRLASALVLVLGLVSIWFDQPARLATGLGLMSAGLAFALQRVITAIAGYFVILRGDIFNVGDRITMGGVRGDVIGLSFMQTKIMEMGQPPAVQKDDPAMWVKSRQYTGRIVSVNNTKIFDEPVYNYTMDFPYLWEEIAIPVAYRDDRRAVEAILLDVARRHSTPTSELGKETLDELQRRYVMATAEVEPRVFWRLTDNWLELAVRFLCGAHGVREVKDAMSREILDRLDEAGITIPSQSFEVSRLPPLRVDTSGSKTLHDRAAS